jgi:23S rRNA pseudouridine2605 synthase
VTINGERCDEPGRRVDPRADRVAVDGERAAPPRAATIVLHKPAGLLVTQSDPEDRPTIARLLHGAPEGVLPVGRLDRPTEGLLILTNDGDLAFRLAHPRFGVERKYLAWVQGDVSPERVRALARGVVLSEGVTAPAVVRIEKRLSHGALLAMTLREGRQREVRRMCEVVGLRVERLVRVAFGPITLGEMPPGSWRRLSDDELARLRRAVGLPR